MKKKIYGGSGFKAKTGCFLAFVFLLSPLLAATTSCGVMGNEYFAFNCILPDRVIEYRLWQDKSDTQLWAEDITNNIQVMITQGNKDWLMEHISTEYPRHCRIFGGKVEEVVEELK